MHIFFHTPFKPLDHPNPSGDLAIARGIRDFLVTRGHWVEPAGRLRTRWIHAKPWLWPRVLMERVRLVRGGMQVRPSLWLTYHTYYKAPDVIGPYVTRKLRIPYVIFQGIYSTKRRREWRTWPGFWLNRLALLSATHIFTNKKEDLTNLFRLIPAHRLTYVAPGIFPRDFSFDAEARAKLRKGWEIVDEPIILSAAMFRPGVKTDGLEVVLRACHRLDKQGQKINLVIAGDGYTREHLKRMAETLLPGRVKFAGHVPRSEMYRYYSAADVFAFPGIRESLGMVYLEAQSCGLPVVAYDNAGVPEVVQRDGSGLLVPFGDETAFSDTLNRLLNNADLRKKMGQDAIRYVRERHDLDINYRIMTSALETIAGNRKIAP